MVMKKWLKALLVGVALTLGAGTIQTISVPALAAPTAISPLAKQRFFDNNGVPLSGGKLFTYAAGTTTKINSYTDSTGGSANTNPVILDSSGYADVWLTPGTNYKFTLSPSTDTDPPTNAIWTVDNLYGNLATAAQNYFPITFGGTANVITASPSPAPTAYVAGQVYTGTAQLTNTGAVTLNIGSLGAKAVSKNMSGGLVALVANDIISGNTYDFEYNGTVFVLKNNSAFAQGANITSAATINLDTATGFYTHVTGTTTITAITLAQGQYRTIVFDGALTLTSGASLILPGTSSITTIAGDSALLFGEASGVVRVVSYNRGNLAPNAIRSYIDGCVLSTAGSSGTMSIAACLAADSTSAVMMNLASSISKTTSTFAVGNANGCLDTGAIANTTWYHFFEIERTDTGVVDVLCSLSPSSPTMPTSYVYFRRIGSSKTDSSAHWTAFIQYGNIFQWLSPVADVAATNPGTSAVTRTLTVPTGVNVIANIEVGLTSSTIASAVIAYVSDLATTDVAASLSAASVASVTSASGGHSFALAQVRVNTSAQIRSRLSASDAGVTLYNNTIGWIDPRGRDN